MENLEKNIPKTAAITKAQTANQLFSLVEKDCVRLLIYEAWGGRYAIETLHLNEIRLQHPPLATKEMFIYLHKKYETLVPVLSQMKRDGSYDALIHKHLTHLIKGP